MSAADHLATYAEGWTKGDLDVILRATAEDYTLDDPNVGVIPKGALADYLPKSFIQTASCSTSCQARVPTGR